MIQPVGQHIEAFAFPLCPPQNRNIRLHLLYVNKMRTPPAGSTQPDGTGAIPREEFRKREAEILSRFSLTPEEQRAYDLHLRMTQSKRRR